MSRGPTRRRVRLRTGWRDVLIVSPRAGLEDGPRHAFDGRMSKNNVNPNHYKVAGRDRQGEAILQERHRQKFARSLVRERFEAGVAPLSPAAPSARAAAESNPSESNSGPAPATTPPARKRSAVRPNAPATLKKRGKKATQKTAGTTTGTRGAKTRKVPAVRRKAVAPTPRRQRPLAGASAKICVLAQA